MVENCAAPPRAHLHSRGYIGPAGKRLQLRADGENGSAAQIDSGRQESRRDSPAAQRLLGFVEFRLHPRERLLELSANLSRKDGSSDFQQDLIDYTMLLDNVGNLAADPLPGAAPKSTQPAGQNSLENLRAASDMTDWVLTMQAPGELGANHALERWNQMHSSAWLVAAIATILPQDPKAAAIVAAAENTSSDSPAFATIAFHRARLLMNMKHQDAARAGLDRLLEGDRANFPPSSLNLLLAQRFKLARNFDEFLKYAPRDAAGIVTFSGNLELPDDKALDSAFSVDQATYKPAPQPPLFDADSVRLINRQLPLDKLKQAASSAALPENLRAQIAQIAWVRAVLLDDDATAQSLAPVVASQTAALKPGLDKFAAENTKDARHFAAIFTMLRNPGLRPNATSGVLRSDAIDAINEYRDNWWCPAAEPTDRDGQEGGSRWAPVLSEPLKAVYAGDNSVVLSFLTLRPKNQPPANGSESCPPVPLPITSRVRSSIGQNRIQPTSASPKLSISRCARRASAAPPRRRPNSRSKPTTSCTRNIPRAPGPRKQNTGTARIDQRDGKPFLGHAHWQKHEARLKAAARTTRTTATPASNEAGGEKQKGLSGLERPFLFRYFFRTTILDANYGCGFG